MSTRLQATPTMNFTTVYEVHALFRAKRGFYLGSVEIIWIQPIFFAWLLKGHSCSSERARLHCWPSGWMAIFKRTRSAYKPIHLLDLLYLAQKFMLALNHLPDHLLLLLYPLERCQTWISILWKVDTSYILYQFCRTALTLWL